METRKLIPAPIDGKNITTDWIEEVFDYQSAVCNKSCYLGFVNDYPCKCVIIDNKLYWSFVITYTICTDADMHNAMRELIKRLKEIDKDNDGITTDYYEMSRSQLVQSFYFVDED